jgi:OPT oligopeptide transporter protein
MWSHDVIGSALYLATDLKMGQYLKIPPRVMILTQVWGTILGMLSILSTIISLTGNTGAIVNYGELVDANTLQLSSAVPNPSRHD